MRGDRASHHDQPFRQFDSHRALSARDKDLTAHTDVNLENWSNSEMSPTKTAISCDAPLSKIGG
jgi:hypothetical protein